MKKQIAYLLALLVLSAGLLTACAPNEMQNLYSFELAPLCIHTDVEGLSVERDTSIDYFVPPYNTPAATVSETFTVKNSGEAAQVWLVYPVLVYADDREAPQMAVDGSPWTQWWGAASIQQANDARYDGTLVEKLNDGTFFHAAFPNWPELGEQVHAVEPPPAPEGVAVYNLSDCCSVSYYVKEVTIPAEDSIVVTAKFTEGDVYKISLLRLSNEIPCTRHTLTVNSDRIKIADQNILDELPAGFPWTAELSTQRDDYYLQTAYTEGVGWEYDEPAVKAAP